MLDVVRVQTNTLNMKPSEAQIEETEIEDKRGRSIDGVILTCADCDEIAEAPGYDTPENREILQVRLCQQCPEKRCHKFKIIV